MDTVTGSGSVLVGFISRQAWDIINFSIIGLAIVAIVMAICSKDSVKMKIINVLFLSFLPPAGIVYFFGRMIYLRVRRMRIAHCEGIAG